VGYVIAIAVNAALLYLLNTNPGWEAIPLVTAAADQVIGLVNLSLVVGIVVNIIYLAADPRGLRALGELVTAVVGVVVALRVWQVFPFDVADTDGWRTVIRVALGIAIAGGSIGALVQLVTLGRLAADPPG
jgi:uncharacterized membrane protein YesL